MNSGRLFLHQAVATFILSIFFDLSNFRFYRKKNGGTWYQIAYPDAGSGFAGQEIKWTQILPSGKDFEIIGREDYQA